MSDNDINLKMIGKNLKRAREEKGLTHTELGDRVGVTDAQISKIERGSRSKIGKE